MNKANGFVDEAKQGKYEAAASKLNSLCSLHQ
jgi:hypothetical protein